MRGATKRAFILFLNNYLLQDDDNPWYGVKSPSLKAGKSLWAAYEYLGLSKLGIISKLNLIQYSSSSLLDRAIVGRPCCGTQYLIAIEMYHTLLIM